MCFAEVTTQEIGTRYETADRRSYWAFDWIGGRLAWLRHFDRRHRFGIRGRRKHVRVIVGL